MKIRLNGTLDGIDAENFIKAKAEATNRQANKFSEKSFTEWAVKKYCQTILGMEEE